MWIKICANTSLEDAQLAARLGADAVGFVFAPSPRRVTPEQVARITPHLPSTVERIGVFPALEAAAIAEAVRIAGLDAVQLHTTVDRQLTRSLHDLFTSPSFAEHAVADHGVTGRIRTGRIRVIQTIHWQVEADEASAAAVARQLREIESEGIVDRVLIDSKVGQATGGTGVAFDWDKARAVLQQQTGHLKLIVAGGLRPDNVAEAIARLNPWGVDVASGVEATPGKKDPDKLAAFLRNARS
ncbi:MAG: phosphoribosylanthranilate isomerase [Edaphobacter sp.]